jgi:hypothetical protein
MGEAWLVVRGLATGGFLSGPVEFLGLRTPEPDGEGIAGQIIRHLREGLAHTLLFYKG